MCFKNVFFLPQSWLLGQPLALSSQHPNGPKHSNMAQEVSKSLRKPSYSLDRPRQSKTAPSQPRGRLRKRKTNAYDRVITTPDTNCPKITFKCSTWPWRRGSFPTSLSATPRAIMLHITYSEAIRTRASQQGLRIKSPHQHHSHCQNGDRDIKIFEGSADVA